MLEVNSVVTGYGNVEVLKGISFRVNSGERVAIQGRSGAGKSTLAKTVVGLLPLWSGSVRSVGEDISNWKSFRRARVGIRYVSNQNGLFSQLTVEENFETGIFGSLKQHTIIPDELFSYFPVLQERRHDLVSEMDHGEKAQLRVARALVDGPSVLILDELLEGIEPQYRKPIVNSLKRIAAENGVGILLLDANPEIVRQFAQRSFYLRDGKLLGAAEAGGEYRETIEVDQVFYNSTENENQSKTIRRQRSRV